MSPDPFKSQSVKHGLFKSFKEFYLICQSFGHFLFTTW
jgi:hypothetical protein